MNRQPFSHWSTSSTSRATVAVNSPTTAAADPVRNLAHYKIQISWKEPNRCSSLAGTKSIDRVAFVRNCRRHAAVARCQRRLTPLRMCARWGLPPALCGSLYPELLRWVCVCVGCRRDTNAVDLTQCFFGFSLKWLGLSCRARSPSPAPPPLNWRRAIILTFPWVLTRLRY